MNSSTEPINNRFVILFHNVSVRQTLTPATKDETRRNHWDLMFECNGQLLTWAVEAEPFKHVTYDAIQLPNHRLDYLTYEGPISGNRGEVRRVIAGSYSIDCKDGSSKELAQCMSEGRFQITVLGDELSWKIAFQRETGASWTLKMTAENC